MSLASPLGALSSLAGLTEDDLYIHLPLTAIDGDGYGVAGTMLVHRVGQILLVSDRLAVYGNNEIAADHDGCSAQIGALTATLQAGAVRGAARNRPHNEDTVVGGKSNFLRQLRSDGQRHDTQRRTPDCAQRDQVVEYCLRRVDGDGKADARALVRASGSDHAVDADHFAVGIQQRPSGIAGIDGSIRLDGFLDVGPFRTADRTQRADDAACHGAGESEGIADGEDLLPDLQ